MTEYQVICNLHESLFNALTNGLQDAEDNAEKEKIAATDIQRCWRGCTVRAQRTHKFNFCG